MKENNTYENPAKDICEEEDERILQIMEAYIMKDIILTEEIFNSTNEKLSDLLLP